MVFFKQNSDMAPVLVRKLLLFLCCQFSVFFFFFKNSFKPKLKYGYVTAAVVSKTIFMFNLV